MGNYINTTLNGSRKKFVNYYWNAYYMTSSKQISSGKQRSNLYKYWYRETLNIEKH